MVLHLFEDESENPEEPKDDVFGHGEVVVSGAEDIIIIKIMMNKSNVLVKQ